MQKANLLRYLKKIIYIAVAGALVYLLFKPILKVSVPFLISLIIAYLLNPIVRFLMSKKISKILSILVIYIIFLLLLTSLIMYLVPLFYNNLNDLLTSVPNIIEKYKSIGGQVVSKYNIDYMPSSVKIGISKNINYFSSFFNNIITGVFSTFPWIISNIFFIALIPFITFYFLKDGEYLKDKLIYLIPSDIRDDATVMWYKIDLVLKRFIRGELTIAIIVGILTWFGMYIIGVKFSLVLGTIAGITNIIPYLGPFLGVIPCLMVAFTQNPFLALKAGLVFFIIQQLESGIISPKIVGNCVGLHPITIIFILLFFEQIFGIWGMFFAVPVISIIFVIFETILNKNIKINKEKLQ